MKVTIDLRHSRTRVFVGVLALAIALPLAALAGINIQSQVTLTTFSPSTPISSSQVNANFASLGAAVQELQNALKNANGGTSQLVATDNTGATTLGGNLSINGSLAGVTAIMGGPGSLALNGGTGVNITNLTATGPFTASGTVTVGNASSTFTASNVTTSNATVGNTLTVATVSAGNLNGNSATVSGAVTAGTLSVSGTKNFVQAHPTDAAKCVVYVCLEGGEAGVYCRGSGQLTAGRATILLPEHFALVANGEQGLTAQVTPTGECRGIFVVKKSATRLEVQELGGGGSDATFDWNVNGLRRAFESHEPIQERAKYPAIFPASDARH